MASQDESVATKVRSEVRRTRRREMPSTPRRYWAPMVLIQGSRSTSCMSPDAASNRVRRRSVAPNSRPVTMLAVIFIAFAREPGRKRMTAIPATGKKMTNVRIGMPKIFMTAAPPYPKTPRR